MERKIGMLTLNSGFVQFDPDISKVNVVIKTWDRIYFIEKIIFRMEMSIYLFLLLAIIGFIPIMLFLLVTKLWQLCHEILIWIFREPDLISPEEADKRLNADSFLKNLSPEQEKQLLSKKELPFGL